MLQGLRLFWNNPYMRGVTALVLLYGLYRLLALTADLWGLLLGALLLAALVRPVLDRLEGLRIPKGLSLLLVLSGLVFALGLLGAVLVGVVQQVGGFAKTLPSTAGGLAAWWSHLPAQLHQSNLPGWLQGTLEQAYGSLGQLIRTLALRLVGSLGAFAQTGLFPALAGLTGGAVKLAAFVVLFIYLLSDGPGMGRSLVGRLPETYRPQLERTLRYLERSVMGYFRGQLVVALSLALVVGIGLWLLGIPLALPVAALVGVLELVPYLGVAIGAVLVAFVALPLGGLTVFKAVAVLIGAAQLEGHLLAPLIVGRTTQLHPVTVLLALLLGERLAGVGGMLVAVPLVAFAKLWLDDWWPRPR